MKQKRKVKINKKRLVIILVVLTIIFVGIVVFINQENKKNEKLEQQLKAAKKDQYGCAPSLGYIWCDVKARCLKNDEERCNPEAEKAILNAFVKKYSKVPSNIRIHITNISRDHATGSVQFAPFDQNSEGGVFLAALYNGEWAIPFSGNGSINCPALERYAFPPEMLKGFCD